MANLISVIIPNLNGKEFIKDCLDSLRKQIFRDFEIILVDNGSIDNSVNYVRENYPEVKIISFPNNLGFSYPVNIGIKEANGKFIVLLNNDTEADSKWLEELYKAIENNPSISFFTSKILFFKDRDTIDACGSFFLPDGRAGHVGHGEKDVGQYDTPFEVFGACACASIYKKDLFLDIGLFDEDFFIYLEDTDLSFRAQLKGHKCLYVPTAIVYHLGSATSTKYSNQKIYYCCKNEINILVKNFPSKLLLKYFYLILKIQLKQTIAFIFKYKVGLDAIKGKLAAFREFKKMLKKRKFIQDTKKLSDDEIDSLLSKQWRFVRAEK